MGECGLHHKTRRCNNIEKMTTLKKTFQLSRSYLFPKQMVLQKRKVVSGLASGIDSYVCGNTAYFNHKLTVIIVTECETINKQLYRILASCPEESVPRFTSPKTD